MDTFFERLMQDEEYARASRQQELIVDVTEAIYKIMDEKNISKADLAKKAGLSKSRITKLLDVSSNITLRSIADIAHALGVKPKVYIDAKDSYYANTSHVSDWSSASEMSYNPFPKNVIHFREVA